MWLTAVAVVLGVVLLLILFMTGVLLAGRLRRWISPPDPQRPADSGPDPWEEAGRRARVEKEP